MNGKTLVPILSLISKTETMSKYGSVTNRPLCEIAGLLIDTKPQI